MFLDNTPRCLQRGVLGGQFKVGWGFWYMITIRCPTRIRFPCPSVAPLVVLLILALVLGGCMPAASNAINTYSEPTPVLTPVLESVRVVIGETPANDANAIVGTWRLEDFTISSEGEISGDLSLDFDRLQASDFTSQDVLIIQILANYVSPGYGDISSQRLKIIPVDASSSSDTSVIFQIDGSFDIPSVMLQGMPLESFQVVMVWYRVRRSLDNSFWYYGAKIGTPEDPEHQSWRGVPILNKVVSQSGTIDTNVRSEPELIKWFEMYTYLPTNTPKSYPVPSVTPVPSPIPSYPNPSAP